MKCSNIILGAVSAATIINAAPLIVERAHNEITDDVILNYALTLEHLENTFYRTGLKNFTQKQFADAGFDATFYKNLQVIASDERTHVDFLTKAIVASKYAPVKECTYAFPVTDPKSFVMISSILEGVGVTAYLGAAAQIMSKDYLTAAGSILTVEARHSSYIRSSLNETGFPSPFDVPLSLNEVYTLAAPFIVSCPKDNPALPLKPFPSLAVAPSATKAIPAVGSTVTILTPGYLLKPADGVSPIFAAFITVAGPVVVSTKAVDGGFELVIPAGISGQAYVVLTGCNGTVTDDTVAAGPAIIEVALPVITSTTP